MTIQAERSKLKLLAAGSRKTIHHTIFKKHDLLHNYYLFTIDNEPT